MSGETSAIEVHVEWQLAASEEDYHRLLRVLFDPYPDHCEPSEPA
jgi:hypothetical protein